MIQPKYSPEEALQRAKLMMGYDPRKTLTENIKSNRIITEAPAANPNMVTDQDMMGSTSWIRTWFQATSDFSGLIGLPNLWDIVGVNWANLIGGRRTGVKGAVDALDGWVDAADLAYVLAVVKSLDGKCYLDPVEETTVSATQRFLELYKEDEGGDDLKSDVDSVGTRTLPTGSEKLKQLINRTIDKQVAAGCKAAPTGGGEVNTRQQNINNIYCSVKNGVINAPSSGQNGKKWDDYVKEFSVTAEEVDTAKKSCSGGGGGGGRKRSGGGGYKSCTGTYSFGCSSSKIAEVQKCLGLTADGKFGKNTQSKLKEKGFTTFTDADVAKICSKTTPVGSDEEDVDVKSADQI